MKEYINKSLLTYNTFGIDVKADRFIEYASVEELKSFLQNERTDSLLHIGGGSNLLFLSDYHGTVLHSAIKGFSVEAETDDWIEIKAGAGEIWDDFVAYTVDNGWYGAENLSLIPGEVGASAVQNIGAYGVEAKDLITKVYTVRVSDGIETVFMNGDCKYAYRNSVFKGEYKGQYIVTHVTYRLGKKQCFHLSYGNISSELNKKGVDLTLSLVRDVIIDIRRSKLPEPSVIGNAGSFFMNPVVPESKFRELITKYPDMPHYPTGDGFVKIPAGWMIDSCGWKGRSIGPAGVYSKQALVLVNLGGATGQDIEYLANEIISSVYDKFGIMISPEVNYI